MKAIQACNVFLALSLILWVVTGCHTTSSTPRIVSKIEWPLSYFLLLPLIPHVGPEEFAVLIVDGKRFTHVGGSPPDFYLKVPHTNAIVFITEDQITATGYVTFHFYSLDAKKDVSVGMGTSGIGHSFGETNGSERVFSFTGTNICISYDAVGINGTRTQTRYNIDLSQQRFVSKEQFFFDETGAVSHHDVFPKSR